MFSGDNKAVSEALSNESDVKTFGAEGFQCSARFRVLRLIAIFVILTLVLAPGGNVLLDLVGKYEAAIVALFFSLGPICLAMIGVRPILYPSWWAGSPELTEACITAYLFLSAAFLLFFYFFLYLRRSIRWFFLTIGLAIWLSSASLAMLMAFTGA